MVYSTAETLVGDYSGLAGVDGQFDGKHFLVTQNP